MTQAEQQLAMDALRRAYSAYNRGDITAALESMDPDIDWNEPLEFPNGGAHRGHAGVRAYLTQSFEARAEGSSEPERMMPVEDRIVVIVHVHVRPNGSSEWHETRIADVFTFRGGKAVHMQAYVDPDEALRSVGPK